jgi:hypothetical protein
LRELLPPEPVPSAGTGSCGRPTVDSPEVLGFPEEPVPGAVLDPGVYGPLGGGGLEGDEPGELTVEGVLPSSSAPPQPAGWKVTAVSNAIAIDFMVGNLCKSNAFFIATMGNPFELGLGIHNLGQA